MDAPEVEQVRCYTLAVESGSQYFGSFCFH
jgi:hypothetical protein